ncbi:Dabb family protein [Octadecabacter sp. G9-8]|uniref:Dabb family protein n=1 Tax=Octadecabacter dasysiphoniae TaxID=2909341 RepID=A0ABS9CZM2_9RHOB|nr:Dabb family protein [Octadecabacter dasysiphoniae]MCF2871829.1 Dabb family protein [Octadecabacter dasysiphoniae]
MIYHAVYLSLTETADRHELASVMSGLENLLGQIDGFVAFHHGPNIDAEGKSPEAHYGFHGLYDDRAALDLYAADPRHQALGARLVALCGGADGIKVYDIETAKDP